MTADPLPFAALLETGDAKTCCAGVYGHPAVRWLLGDRLHPGGAATTLRCAELISLEERDRVLDVASGPGASAIQLASERGCSVVGVELSPEAVDAAGEAASQAGVADRASFLTGDAESLPVPDDSFDALLCECSLCTFPDKPTAVSEFARVLRPGGRLAISDVVADVERLPPGLSGMAAHVACVAGALTAAGYEELLAGAGFELVETESRDGDAAAMADRVQARLRVARMVDVPALEPFRDDLDAAVQMANLALEEIGSGRLGYSVLTARQPG